MPAGSATNARELSERHRRVYDLLAPEYDSRVEALRPVVGSSLSKLLARIGTEPSRILDVGCGAGLATSILAGAGHRVTALDLSSRMSALTAARAPQASVLTGDYQSIRFSQPFDAIVAFAFIHLFPAGQAEAVLARMRGDLVPGGHLFIGTTASDTSSEGFEGKADYPGAPARFRRRWTEPEFRSALAEAGFRMCELLLHRDPFGKQWMDAIVCRPAEHARAAGRTTFRSWTP